MRNVNINAQARFLARYGEDYLSFRDGCIVVDTYYDKQFRALGGDPRLLMSYLDDYCNVNEAARHYLEIITNDPTTLSN